MGPFSLMVARFPGMNQEHPESSGYVINLQETLLNDDRAGAIIPFRISDTPITMCRNRCVKQALAMKVDYLLMIDADMSPDCEAGAPPFWETAWDFMMERRQVEEDRLAGKYIPAMPDEPPDAMIVWNKGRPAPAPATIAAPYCGPPPTESVYVFRWSSKENVGAGNHRMQLEMIDREHAASLKGIEEVAALPTGLILYDMRVFKKLPAPWFDYEYRDAPYNTDKITTEDVYQTRNASMLGMPQFCAWDCWAGHVKQKTVTKPIPLAIHTVRQDFADACIRARDAHNARKS